MLKNKLVIYFIKWILLFYVILTIINIVFYKNIYTQAGLTLGCILCFAKYWIFAQLIIKILTSSNKSFSPTIFSIIQYILYMSIIVILLIIFQFINYGIVIGLIAGIIVGPIVLFCTCLLNGLGLNKTFFNEIK